MSFTQQPNGPRGFSVARASRGTPNRSVEYHIADEYGTSIYRGAPVSLHTDGTIIVPADVDARILGVFDGCEYVDTEGNVKFSSYWPASTSVKSGTVVKARVYEAQGELFLIRSDEDLVQADVGEYFALTALSGGSDVTGNSSIALDGSTNGVSVVDKTVVLRDIPNLDDGNARLALVQFIRPTFAESFAFPATA